MSSCAERTSDHRLVTPPLPPGSCSSFTDEELAGTAAHENLWVALEHPGNWGRDIYDGHAFDAETSAALQQKMADAGARLLLIRKPGRAGQAARAAASHRVFVADAAKARLYALTVKDARDLLDLPLDTPQLIAGARQVKETLLLVCTNAKRDRCCALAGRPMADFLSRELPADTVWECSHTGGHRFAPVAIALPTGYTYGRLNAASGLSAYRSLAEHNAPSTLGLRGRSTLDGAKQAAEVLVRRELAEAGETPSVDDLTISEQAKPGARSAGVHHVVVAHRDGRRWELVLEQKGLPPRPASCGKEAKPGASWVPAQGRPASSC